MNYVLLNADGSVVGRSRVAGAFAEEAGFTIFETEAWPEPGMILADDAFQPAPVPIDLAKERAARAIMTERDRRIDGGFTFGGVRYQTRPGDRENIAGAAQLALMATMTGAGAGDLRWHGGDSDFVWIAEDNSEVAMDAPTVIAFAKAAAEMKSACIFHAKALKEDVAAAADGAAIDSIDIASGWPG